MTEVVHAKTWARADLDDYGVAAEVTAAAVELIPASTRPNRGTS
jgi:hypothetical protein